MDDVIVHYDSPRPARFRALAYAQGPEIHVAPGEKRHLPHEAWHVVQQKQGRVRPTVKAREVSLNDDTELEREASVMGAQAMKLANLAGANRASMPPLPTLRDPYRARRVHRAFLQIVGPASQPIQLLLNPVDYPTTYQGVLTNHVNAVNLVTNELNHRVDAAHQQSIQWQTLSQNADRFVQQWYITAQSYAQNPDLEPSLIHARFGYSIESMACQGLNNTTLHGLRIQTQVSHGHTRPDVVLSETSGNEDVAWIDITSEGSEGHIRGKQGSGWNSKPFVRELIYPQLQLRSLLEATSDPYFSEYGAFLAGERQIEMEAKERNRTIFRNQFLDLADREGWRTGTGNQANKRRRTRDFFMTSAADEGVEEEASSIKNTRGALSDLKLNPGIFGFNQDSGQSNQRIKEVVDAASAGEIELRQGQLSAETTWRILTELRRTTLPAALLDSLEEDFYVEPTARPIAIAAMALKGVVQDLDQLHFLVHDISTQMNLQNARVSSLVNEVKEQIKGPASPALETIREWRQGVRPLEQKALALHQVLVAGDALNQYTSQQKIGWFNRPRLITSFFEHLDRDPPDADVARQVMQWLAEQAQAVQGAVSQ